MEREREREREYSQELQRTYLSDNLRSDLKVKAVLKKDIKLLKYR